MIISVVILNYNGEKDTKECLESLLKCSTSGFDLNTIVVDNFSARPIKIDSSKFKKINLQIIFNKQNLGFSGGMNAGIEKALKEGADYVVVLNNDTVVDKNFLHPLLKAFDKHPKTGIAVPKIYYATGFEFHKKRYSKKDLGKVIWYAGGETNLKTIYGMHYGVDVVDKGQFNKEIETKTATGCCMIIKREVFEKIGEFDNNYFLYYEDADLSKRAKDAGFKIYFIPNSVIWHKNAQSSGGSGSTLQDYYVTRNRMYLGLRYAPFKTKLHLIRESLSLLRRGRLWQKKAILDYYLGVMGKGSFTNA